MNPVVGVVNPGDLTVLGLGRGRDGAHAGERDRCGGGGQVVNSQDTRRKLDLVVEIAEEVWSSG